MPLPPVIGRYRTRGLLGTGTFATVVLAEDEALETLVAVKLLAENWSLDPDVRARFVREARILRRIESDRLIRVHDIGEFEQRPYFVMDFAPGGALGDRLRALRDRGVPLGHGAALRLAGELAGCVGAAHSFGLVHRDVKPSNLLVRRSRASDPAGGQFDDAELLAPGEVLVLADFGLARDMAAGSALSVGAGTESYMAPEQTDPSMAVDERTDLYACTMTLAAALTATPAELIADADRRATALAALDPPIAHALERGLAVDREERPSSAAEWLTTVETAVRAAQQGASRPRLGPAPRRPGLP
ncbi:MAG: serine/threonine-protein kinase, partial [Acidimicrobiia bacterium]